jgi:hypothetical protein
MKNLFISYSDKLKAIQNIIEDKPVLYRVNLSIDKEGALVLNNPDGAVLFGNIISPPVKVSE